jgi:hypothetical protein
MSRKKWVVTFNDDHTHVYWVQLMGEKSEAEQTFKDLFQMIETQSQTKIDTQRFDNKTEYFNKY